MKFFLIASSDLSIRESLEIILSDRFKILVACSGQQALGVLLSHPIDILFLDPNLSDYKGLTLSDKISELNLNVSIIVMKPFNSMELVKNGYNSNIQEVLNVPFEPDYVNFVVNRTIERNELIKKMNYLETAVSKPTYHSSGNSFSEAKGRTPFDSETFLDGLSNYRQYAMGEFFKSLTHISNLERLIDYSIRGVAELFGLNKASIMLLDDLQNRYTIKASIGLNEDTINSLYFKATSVFPAWFLRFNQILRKEEAGRTIYRDHTLELLEALDMIQSQVSAPLLSRGNLIGILNLGNKLTGKPYYDDDYELISMIANYLAVAIDNSSLYKKISFQKRYNENILKNITSGVIAIDKLGKITTYNKTAENVLKIPSDEIIGRPIQNLGSIVADILLRTLEGHDVYYRHEIIYPYTKAPLGISTSQLKEGSEEIDGAIMVFSDLTQAKELEEQTQAVERLDFWRNLSNRLAQEIRNPLVAIQTFAQLLPQRYNDPNFRNEFYEIVSSEIGRLNSITHKLIMFAEPRENNLEIQNINEIINQTILLHEKSIVSKRAKLTKRLSEQELIAAIDKRNFQEALSNLIQNSLDAIPEGGKLRIRTCLENGRPLSLNCNYHNDMYVQIEVEDSGSGIPLEHLNHIFSPFFTTKINAMGFGLPITQRIIQDHKGRIDVTTEPGRGTCFKIYLPVPNRGAA